MEALSGEASHAGGAPIDIYGERGVRLSNLSRCGFEVAYRLAWLTLDQHLKRSYSDETRARYSCTLSKHITPHTKTMVSPPRLTDDVLHLILDELLGDIPEVPRYNSYQEHIQSLQTTLAFSKSRNSVGRSPCRGPCVTSL